LSGYYLTGVYDTARDTKMPEELKTMTNLSDELGVSKNTISDLVRLLEIETKPIPTNGRARGLDRAAVRLIRERLRPAGKRK